uniref:Uncharacterized protein n=1 Tax=Arundo donax TaxID=35708 RepID=A0A0A8Z634_ARUDO
MVATLCLTLGVVKLDANQTYCDCNFL